MKIKSFILIYCLLLTIISCQKSEHENKIPIEDQVQTFEKSDKISITNDLGEAINNAQLLLEVNEKSIWTNASTTGEIIVPKEWVSNARITIKAPNYMTLTLNDQLPSLKKISLKKVPSLPTLNLSGTVSGFDIKDKDGYIDFALITESFTKNTLTQLDFNKIISPLTENISVAGYSIPLPQNIYLPKQKESYFITLVLQKLNFIVNFSDYGQKKLSALSGRFPFKKVLSEIQNKKPYYELVNLFEMKSTSEVSFDFNSINLSKDIQLNKVNSPEKKLITAPNYNSDQVMIALNCLKTDSSIAPLDIKKVNSGETVELKSQAGNNLLFAGIIKNKADFESSNENMERISVVILPWQTNLSYQFLSTTENPKFLGKNEFSFDLPKTSSQIQDIGMKIVLSETKTTTNRDGKSVDYKIPFWEYYTPSWTSKIILPETNQLVAKKYQLEVSFLAKKADNSRKNKFYSVSWSYENQIDTASHISKSATHF